VSNSNNSNAKKLFVYDDENLKFELFGNSKEMTILHNLKWSARKFGEPIGIHKQTRIELRKKCKQSFIAWYGLYDGDSRSTFDPLPFNIKDEQTLGLLKDKPKLGRRVGAANNKAKKIEIYDNNHELQYFCHGKLAKFVTKTNCQNQRLLIPIEILAPRFIPIVRKFESIRETWIRQIYRLVCNNC